MAMKTKSVGDLLKEKRTFHRLSLESLSEKTKIKIEYLEALENSEFEKLPGASFVRGYIKTYARIFRFDHQPLIALLRRDFKESAKGMLVPREFIKPILKKRQLSHPITIFALSLASVFVVLLLYVGVQWYNLQKPPMLEIFTPQEDALVSSQVVVEGKTTPEAVVAVNAQPVALQQDGSFRTEVFLPREGIFTLTIEATDRREKTSVIQRTVYVKF